MAVQRILQPGYAYGNEFQFGLRTILHGLEAALIVAGQVLLLISACTRHDDSAHQGRVSWTASLDTWPQVWVSLLVVVAEDQVHESGKDLQPLVPFVRLPHYDR